MFRAGDDPAYKPLWACVAHTGESECPRCQKEMRIVALIDDQAVIERILRHLGLWQQGVRVAPGTDPPADWVIEPCFDDALPDYDTAPDLAYANE